MTLRRAAGCALVRGVRRRDVIKWVRVLGGPDAADDDIEVRLLTDLARQCNVSGLVPEVTR